MSDNIPNWDLGLVDLGLDEQSLLSFFSQENEPIDYSRSNTQPMPVPNVLENVQNFIDGQKKENTVSATKTYMKTLNDWLFKFKLETTPIENISLDQLNLYLLEFFVKITKKMGQTTRQPH